MPKNNYKFHENEKVMCFHGPVLYDAKVQKVQEKETKDSKEKVVHYHVHYLGWSKSWDEWVPEDRVCKVNAETLQKQKDLSDAQSKSNKKSAKKKSLDPKDKESLSPNVSISLDVKPKPKPMTPLALPPVPVVSTEVKESAVVLKEMDGQRKKRIRLETTVVSEDILSNKGPDVDIKIIDTLKQYLVDDWDHISQKKLVRLPSKVSVNKILDDYVKQRLQTKVSPTKDSAVREAAEGIREFFNSSIGNQLLYSFERNQYKDLIKDTDDDSKASTVYGGIHLLRLFVKLGSLLAYLNLDEKGIQLITEHIHDFLKYLERNPSLFSSNEYEFASADYLKKLS